MADIKRVTVGTCANQLVAEACAAWLQRTYGREQALHFEVKPAGANGYVINSVNRGRRLGSLTNAHHQNVAKAFFAGASLVPPGLLPHVAEDVPEDSPRPVRGGFVNGCVMLCLFILLVLLVAGCMAVGL